MSRRILITGIDTFWGSMTARSLENDPSIDTIIGLGTSDPKVELERTECLRADHNYSIVSRIIKATKVDTVMHTFMATETSSFPSKMLNENNVIGTMNLLAAVGGSRSVKKLIVKSSSLVYGSSSQDPTFFTEQTRRPSPAKLKIEKSIIEAESYVKDFAQDNPHISVSLLRFCNVIGDNITTTITKNLRKRVLPYLFGFDPSIQFVYEDDVVAALVFAANNSLEGIFNVAGDERIPWSEVASIAGARLIPLFAYATNIVSAPLISTGFVKVTPELYDLMKFGRGVTNSKLKEVGFTYSYTTPSALAKFCELNQLRKNLGSAKPEYKYHKDVETFFKHSPAVVKETVKTD
jgi:UDP-glucose 4-epimerase